MKKKYLVLLPINVAGETYEHGQTIELDEETATLYRHALIAVPEGEQHGRNS